MSAGEIVQQSQDQRAYRLRALVIDSLKAAPGWGFDEIRDFTEAYSGAMDASEQILICRKWLRAIEKTQKVGF